MFITYNSGKDIIVNVTGSDCKAKNLKPALIVNVGTETPALVLSRNLIIPAKLVSEILVSDKGTSQLFRIKFLADVYDEKNEHLVIHKDSIAVGRTTSFDVDTATMNLEVDSVQMGGRAIKLKFDVASANLSSGLKGEVRDTRGQILAGAFYSDFSTGAIESMIHNKIDSSFQLDRMEKTSGLIQQRIAEMYAGDLQNAARIFYVPVHSPVILIPSSIN